MNAAKTDTLLIMLMVIVILLMVTNVGLFLRMNQLQSQITQAFQPIRQPEGLSVGTKAPHFSLTDTNSRSVSLQDFAGHRVLLMFSATTCPYCQQMYPTLKRFSENYSDITVLMISRGSQADNQQLVEDQGFTFPVLSWQDEVAKEYQVPGTPFFYVINSQSIITSQGTANSLEQLEKLAKAGG